jgi:hypothetical protein
MRACVCVCVCVWVCVCVCVCVSGVLNLLWGAGNVGKIWSSWGRHKIQYPERWMNNFTYNYMHYITLYFSKYHMQCKYTDNKRSNSRQLATLVLVIAVLAHFYKMSQYVSINKMKVKQSLHRPITGPEGSRKLRTQDFQTTGTWRWWGCQPYAPAAFILQEYSWYSVPLETIMRPARLSHRKMPTFRLVAQCLNQLRHCVPFHKQTAYNFSNLLQFFISALPGKKVKRLFVFLVKCLRGQNNSALRAKWCPRDTGWGDLIDLYIIRNHNSLPYVQT